MPPRQTVLIVEDDPGLRYLFRTVLASAGFEVREAGDGVTALALVEQHPPDLIVLDLGLPKLGGLAVQQQIAARAQSRRIPIVVTTGSTANLDHIDVDCVLIKPITADRLVEVVRKILESSAPPAC